MKKRSLVGFFLFLAVIISFLSFNVSAEKTVAGEFVAKISGGNFEVGFFDGMGERVFLAQFLLFILVTLIVYALSESLPFLKGSGGYIKGGIAIVIGILSIFFLDDTEVYSILLSYGTLGIVLSGVIPFILLAIFTTKLTSEGYNFISRIIWVVFGIVLVGRFFSAKPEQIGGFGLIVYPILFILVVIMLIWEKTIVGKMAKEKLGNKIDKFKNRVKAATAVEKSRAEAVYSADDDEGVTPV